MFESETTDVIRKRMLQRVSPAIDKREGSIIHDATAPAAIELELLYATLDFFLKATFADTAPREFLVERAKERGMEPYPASAAVVKVAAVPSSVSLPIGSRFSCDDVNYVVTKKLETEGEYEAACETAGTIGNKPEGNIIPIDFISGLQTASLTDILVPGEDEEETEAFRARYLASFNSIAYGGNVADYKEKVNAIPGVGGVKVYPVWNGGGTVRVVFMTSENKSPEDEFVQQVQTAIDPTQNHGEGIGIAPIGHTVTVEGVKNEAVNIGLNIEFRSGENWSLHEAEIRAAIQEYFDTLNAGWESTQEVSTSRYSNDGIIVRISQIESRLLNESYIKDLSHTTLNGAEENIELADDALAALGTVTGISGGA